MYQATITAALDPVLVGKCFAQEERDIQGRATYSISRAGRKTVFCITAKDSTALRTAMNAITKLLTTIEKTEHIT